MLRCAAIGNRKAVGDVRLAGALVGFAGALAALSGPMPAVACGPATLEPVRVLRIEDGDIRLADGRLLRLAGLATDAAPATSLATRLSAADSVAIGLLGSDEDRWGRRPALVFMGSGATLRWLQGEMLAAGEARAWPTPEIGDCWPLFGAAEAPARIAKLGVWRDPHYAVLQSGEVASLAGQSLRQVVVEGRISRVGQGRVLTYLNFRGNDRLGFAATVTRKREKAFAEAGLTLAGLSGRRVRLRGLVGGDGPPRMALTTPEQIEFIE